MRVDALYESGFDGFCRERAISLVVLFGSRATGQARKGSDWDLAVWLEDQQVLASNLVAARLRRQLVHDFCNFLQTGNLDLVILNRATPLLKFEVARTGKPVYEKEPSLFAAFCSRALREHNDARIFYRATEEYLNNSVKEWQE